MLVDFYRRRMCQSSSFVPSWEASGPTSSSSAVIPKEITNVVQGVMHLPYRKRKPVVVALLSIVITTAVLFATLYAFNPGFRRTCQFWSSVTPVAIEYRFIKFKSKYIDKVDDDELKRRINSFHKRTAPKMVAMVQYLGGIYVKIGQMLATIGAGFLDDEYLRALRPLQDGVSPRSKQQVFEIIERSTGKKMEDMFESFDETPIGAASIGQAHRATLLPSTTTVSSNDGVDRYGDAADVGNEVVVKVQYPEVASLFNVDFNNLELVTRWINPENLDFVKKIRQRHENELDFTIEAENLRECTRNMQAHGVEPRLVRVPRVRNETGICTQHVLVMEYLRGVSLADAIEREQNAIAQALGGKDASEFRTEMIKRMKDHFERGGGADDGGKIGMVTNEKKMRLVSLAGPLALKVLRAYAVSRDAVLDTLHKMDQAFQTVVRLPNNDNLSSGSKQDRKKPRINIARALKTLVHVHGLQMIKDGVYNADPHPGNVLVLPCGRLGLLDYGMIGRVSEDERITIAKTILSLSNNNHTETARIYKESGYKASWADGDISDDSIIHRIATFHLDRVDLSPVYISDRREKVDILSILRTTRERQVPDWVNQARRLGGLLIGVSTQAARPISLANEWKTIAHTVLKDEGHL